MQFIGKGGREGTDYVMLLSEKELSLLIGIEGKTLSNNLSAISGKVFDITRTLTMLFAIKRYIPVMEAAVKAHQDGVKTIGDMLQATNDYINGAKLPDELTAEFAAREAAVKQMVETGPNIKFIIE